MTRNNPFKKAVRAYQQAHPELTYPQAKRAVAYSSRPRRRCKPGQVPWVRTDRDTSPTCYFCGEREPIVSATDLHSDNGRVAMPATTRNAMPASSRSSSCATGPRPPRNAPTCASWSGTSPLGRGRRGHTCSAAGGLPGPHPTRADGRDMKCLFCGEQSCAVTDDDVAADTGRIRLRCTNSLCAVQVVEVLIYRDGTGLCGERPDVKGLDDIKPTRARDLRRAGPTRRRHGIVRTTGQRLLHLSRRCRSLAGEGFRTRALGGVTRRAPRDRQRTASGREICWAR